MSEIIRWSFLSFYAVGLVVLALKVIPEGLRERAAEIRPGGAWPHVANLLLPLQWLVPPVLIYSRVGQLDQDWYAVRLIGVLLGVYAAVFQLWASGSLGRFLVPYAAVFSDHELVTSGPYRFVRHPIYSGNLALFLGSALGTLNVYLLALWPLVLAGFTVHARFEERFLRAKFGVAFDGYARRTGLLVPWWSRREEGR